jgi:intracellular septation protein
MKFLFDLFPILLFFAVFRWGEGHTDAARGLAQQYLSGFMAGTTVTATLAPILLATAVAIVTTFLQLAYVLARRKKVHGTLWFSLATITVFGGATIYFQNDTFIKWKPTVMYWSFTGALLISEMLLKKNLVRSMFEEAFSLPEPMWFKLNMIWAIYFLLMGLLNLYVAFNFPVATWVSFKVFGFSALMAVFVLAQIFVLSKYIKDAP